MYGAAREREEEEDEKGLVLTSLPSHLSILILESDPSGQNNQAVYSRKKSALSQSLIAFSLSKILKS